MPEKRTVFLFERGINGWQSIFGTWKNWPNEAIVFIHLNTEFRAQTLEYFTGAILAGLTRRGRAKQFAKMIRAYSCEDWTINIVAHSEGTATVIEAMKLAGWPKINNVHLLCGACDSNFERCGLNHALYNHNINQVFAYIAGKDWAMKLENTLLGKELFDIPESDKSLGLVGPQNVRTSVESRVHKISGSPWNDYGHSDCFLEKNFASTLRCFLPA